MEVTALSVQQQAASRRVVIAGIALTVLIYAGWLVMASVSQPAASAQAIQTSHETGEPVSHAGEHASSPHFFSALPFVLLLLAIAILPLSHKTGEWWEGNWNKLFVAAGLGILVVAYYVLAYPHGVIDHTTHESSQPGVPAALTVLKNALLVDYIPFITLLFSLYVISGGISIEGHLVGKPRLNVGIIATGSVLASMIGTTGAAMLLIRPLLNANAKRRYIAHTVVFFIFLVCNVGGSLTPLGDPPLFLGYLHGVDFTWTLRLWPEWIFMNVLLLAIYFVWDTIRYRQEHHETVEARPDEESTLVVRGKWNFLWLCCIVACVALLDPSKPFPGTNWSAPLYFREVAMLVLTALSLATTHPETRHNNSFNYDPILEVAILFSGIFVCMQAPIQILDAYGPSLGFNEPWKYYWGSGILSSFLDNAPTYVVFFETAKSMGSTGPTMAGVDVKFLAAISLGSVYMGAMTYIGNGPNFMVKTIAEKNNVRMPSFFGYMLYSCTVLLPLSILMTLLFL